MSDKSILFYVKGNKSSGMGHICRSYVLARELEDRGIEIAFETEPATPGYHYLADRGVTINDFSKSRSTIIIDLENGPDRNLLLDARTKFDTVIVVGGVGFPIHDQASIDELVDLQIYQSVIVTNPTSATNSISGPEYIILNPDYIAGRNIYPTLVSQDALVIMGGADPHNLTPKVCMRLLSSFNGYKPSVKAVFGPASHVTLLPDGVERIVAPPSLVRPLCSSKFAVSALGMTTYEAACIGVPTASICWSNDHSFTADALERLGVTVNLGLWSEPHWGKLGTFVDKMHNKGAWEKMHEAGRELVDGRGASRVADAIENIL